MPHLRVKTGLNKGKIFEIEAEPITLGRDDNQTLQILDQGVSRQHAEIFRLGEMIYVRDLSSTNGTYVNGTKISEESLKAGDEILIGTTLLAMEEQAPDDAETFDLDEGEKDAKPAETGTTVELKVDTRVVGEKVAPAREVESRNLTLTYEIGRVLHEAKGLAEVFPEVLRIVGDAVQADSGAIFLVDRKTGKLIRKAAMEREAGAGEKVSRTIVKRVMATGRPVLTTDAALDERFAVSESVVLKKIKSVLCAPILLKDQVAGLLYFHSSKVAQTFRVEDLELLSAAALQLTMMLNGIEANARLRRGMMSTIKSLVTAMEIVDPKDQGHAERVAGYGAAVGAQLGLSLEEIHTLRLASLLHDVGKLAVHHSVHGVTREKLREQHVLLGEKILSTVEGFQEILPIVRYHHERADGSGFPYRLKNAETPMPARILIVTNAFDNECTRGGVGGEGIPAKEVLKDLAQRGGKEFDDDVVKALLICHRNATLYSAGRSEPAS